VIADQVSCGIDVPTDGEVRCENYVHYQYRHFEGFNFSNLPGPMTMSDTNTDAYYEVPKALSGELAEALNSEVLALAKAGCKVLTAKYKRDFPAAHCHWRAPDS